MEMQVRPMLLCNSGDDHSPFVDQVNKSNNEIILYFKQIKIDVGVRTLKGIRWGIKLPK